MNKYVTFSIRTSKVWHAHSIWMLCPMVYWLFLVAFSQNRTLASAGHPSLATTVVRQAEEALLFQEKTLAWAVNYGITSKSAGRKEWAKRDLHQVFPQEFCLPSLQGKRSYSLLTKELHPGFAGASCSLPQQALHTAFVLPTLLVSANSR